MSKQYSEGDVLDLPDMFYIKRDNIWTLVNVTKTRTKHKKYPFFRKYFALDDAGKVESKIVKILRKNPKNTLIKIFKVTKTYYDAELLDLDFKDRGKIFKEIKVNLQHLHDLKIIYVDLKNDNIGYSNIDKKWKLFDFDCSGIISNKNKWKHEAPFYFSYKLACKIHTKSDTTPFEMEKCFLDPLLIDKILFDEWSHGKQ